MKLQTWFPTPIWYDDLVNFDDVVVDLIAEKWITFSEKNTNNSIKISNVGGWQSFSLNLSDCDEQEKKLFEIIKENIEIVTSQYSMKVQIKFDNWWVNINGNLDYNIGHKHPGAILSGIFYLKVPDSDPGNLIFHRQHDDFHLQSYTKGNNELTYTRTIYPPVKKRLIVFPAWLEHSVERNMSNQKRISISFNCVQAE